MSAALCGCDPEQDWICEAHRRVKDADVVEQNVMQSAALVFDDATAISEELRAHVEAFDQSVQAMNGPQYTNAYARNREAWERVINIGAEMNSQQRDATPIEESLIDVQRIAHMLVKEVQALAAKVERAQKDAELLATVRVVLATFHRAPVSLSSLQPVLDLAVELNPYLKVSR